MQSTRDIEKYAADYLNDKFENVMSYYRKLMIKDFLNKYKPKHIIDIGPAYNYLFNDYENFDSYTIIEPSTLMCGKIPHKSGVKIINDLFENVSEQFINQPIDFIIVSGLIHEIEDPQIFMQKIHSICNKNTILHISAPNNTSFHMVYAKEAGIIKKLGEVSDYSKKMQRLRTFNMKTLTEFVQSSGFHIIESGPFFFKFFNQTKMEKCIQQKIITLDLLDALNAIAKKLPEYAAEIWINGEIS